MIFFMGFDLAKVFVKMLRPRCDQWLAPIPKADPRETSSVESPPTVCKLTNRDKSASMSLRCTNSKSLPRVGFEPLPTVLLARKYTLKPTKLSWCGGQEWLFHYFSTLLLGALVFLQCWESSGTSYMPHLRQFQMLNYYNAHTFFELSSDSISLAQALKGLKNATSVKSVLY